MKSTRNTYLLLAAIALLLTSVFLIVTRTGQDALPSSETTDAEMQPTTDHSARDLPNRANPREADRLLKAEGARTDVTLSSFPIKEYQHLPAPSGKPAGAPVGEAYIHVPSAGRRVAMNPNQLGEFPTIETRLNDTVGVRIALDAVKPVTPVRVVILDGGSFPAGKEASKILKTTGKEASKVLKATDWRGVAFEYTTSANVGTHRVLVQAVGQPSRILDFSAHDAKDSWPAPSTASTN